MAVLLIVTACFSFVLFPSCQASEPQVPTRQAGDGSQPARVSASQKSPGIDLDGLKVRLEELARDLSAISEAVAEHKTERRLLQACLEGKLSLQIPGSDTPIHMIYVPPCRYSAGLTEAQLIKVAKAFRNPLAGHNCVPSVDLHPPRGFFIGYREVTYAHWRAFEKSQPSADIRNSDNDISIEKAVSNITWEQASAFCDWLSQGSGLEIRLPSELEWELAARGPEGRLFPSPVTSLTDAPVGSLSWIGISGMADGVAEWCLDEHRNDFYRELKTRQSGLAPIRSMDPIPVKNRGPSTERTYRGGSDAEAEYKKNYVMRRSLAQSTAGTNVGFRIVLNIPPDKVSSP